MRPESGATDTEANGQRIEIYGVSWECYVTINDALSERSGLKMIFCDGTLTMLKRSRAHLWYAGRLCELAVAVASGVRILWESAGGATFRRKDVNAGLEGDRTLYFGKHAELMKGPRDIDLAVQPPPDLAIEVDVSYTAGAAMAAWGRLGVPEVWRFGPASDEFGFWLRRGDGSYVSSEHGLAIPVLTIEDVVAQMRLAERIGASAWYGQLDDWVRKVVRPRLQGGG